MVAHFLEVLKGTLCYFQKQHDFPILATKGQICAIKDAAFQATSTAMGIKDLPGKMLGGQVKLEYT